MCAAVSVCVCMQYVKFAQIFLVQLEFLFFFVVLGVVVAVICKAFLF